MKKVKPELINTKRLILKSITISDQNEVVSILINNEVKKTYMIPDFSNIEEAIKLFNRIKEISENKIRFTYGIYLNNKLIGFINDVEIKDNAIELGFVIDPIFHNQGFTTEVLTQAINELFKLGYKKVITGAFEENLPSQRVMEKSGMRKLKQTEEIEYRGKVHKCIMYERECDI